uniref:Polycystic kidney disease 2-like 1 protein n=1 Tax=Acrobeloides nanus TaxID=290746 RepID=A0A914EK68_9BILA
MMWEADTSSFSRKFYIIVLFWFFVLEPLKAFIMSFIYSKFHEDYRVVNKYEKAILLVKPKNELIRQRISWYDNQPAWGMLGYMNDKVSRTMGIGMIRQVRSVNNKNCDVLNDFERYFDTCIGYTHKRYEDTTPAYSPSWAYSINASEARYEYTYRTQANLSGQTYYGTYDTYSGGGYTVLLNGSQPDLAAQLQRLQNEKWIDGNTRAVFIQFSTYNAHINYFGIVNLILEIPPIGSMYSDSWIEVIKLYRYIGGSTGAVIFFEVLYISFTIVLALKNIYCLCKNGLAYLKSFWNLMDISIMLVMIASVIIYIIRFFVSIYVSNWFAATNGNVYINLENARDLEIYFLSLLACVILLTVMKMIRILRFNRRIDVFTRTLNRSASSIAGFSLCLFVFLMAFNFAIYMLLFDQLRYFNTMYGVIFENIAAILGKASIVEILNVSTIAAVTFMIFNLAGTVVLLNVFIMIVMYEFKEVRNDKKNQTNDYEAIDHVKTKAMIAFKAYKRQHMTSLGLPNNLEVCTPARWLLVKLNELMVHANNLRGIPEKLVVLKPSKNVIN